MKTREEPNASDFVAWAAIFLACFLGVPAMIHFLPAHQDAYYIRIRVAEWPATITLSSDQEEGAPGNGKCIAEPRCVARFTHPLTRVRIQYGLISRHPPSCDGTRSLMVAELTQNGQPLVPVRCEPLPNGAILSF